MAELTSSGTEAAEALGVSRRTVYNLLHREDFSRVVLKIGSRRLISRELLAAWVREQAGGKEEAAPLLAQQDGKGRANRG